MPRLPDPGIYGASILGVTQGFSAFVAFLPSLADIRKSSLADIDMAADVRMGEVAACAVTIGIGVVSSSLTGSPVPALTAVLVSFLLVFMYESTLKAERPFEPKGLDNAKSAT
jgi:hypothetical protein